MTLASEQRASNPSRKIRRWYDSQTMRWQQHLSRKLRRIAHRFLPRYWNTCLECGFLTVNGQGE